MMIINIDVRDKISPMLVQFLETHTKFIRSATKSVGWFSQKLIKEGVLSGAPNGSAFVDRIPYNVRKALSSRAKENWYGSMINAIGYQYENGTVRIGWTSKTASMYGHVQEYGTERVVTSNMRKLWASKGFPLAPDTTVLNVPARPIFDPMSLKLDKEVPGYVEQKVNSYMQGNIDFGNKNAKRRKYKVYA